MQPKNILLWKKKIVYLKKLGLLRKPCGFSMSYEKITLTQPGQMEPSPVVAMNKNKLALLLLFSLIIILYHKICINPLYQMCL